MVVGGGGRGGGGRGGGGRGGGGPAAPATAAVIYYNTYELHCNLYYMDNVTTASLCVTNATATSWGNVLHVYWNIMLGIISANSSVY